MALTLIDGFDLYNGTGANTGLAAKYTVAQSGTGSGMSLTTGRFSGQCLRCTIGASSNQNVNVSRLFTAAGSVSMGFAFRRSSMGDSLPIWWLLNSGTYQVGLMSNADGSLTAGRYTAITTSTALGSSSPGVILLNTWHYIEIEITISDTVGVFKVYVDGVQVINLTSQDTRNGTPTTVDTYMLGSNKSPVGAGANLDYDDLYLTDAATKLGERRVETLYPTSDVAQGFARSTGSTNYTLVDEAQVNGDTDYVQGSSVGDTDTYGLGDLSSTPSAIDGVQLAAFAMKTDAGSRSIALQAKSGATTSDGSNYTLAASYGKFERLLTTDPNTGSAWTASAVNALQGGPKVTV